MAKTSGMRSDEDMSAETRNARMSQDRSFLTKLFEGALAGDGEKVKELVEKYGTEHDLPPEEVLSQFKDGQKRTALHFACQSTPRSPDEDVVAMMLLSKWIPQAGAEAMVRLKDNNGLSPLMLAAQHPDNKVAEARVDMLLQVGGNKLALARSHAGAAALHYAAGAGATAATIRRLCDAGEVALRTSSRQGGTPLHWAAAVGPPLDYTHTLRALKECGADLDALNDQGLPPLVMAAAAGNDRHAKFLVQAGADRSKILPGNVTIFHIAADLNLVGTLAALFEADEGNEYSLSQDYCTRKNDQGETPLDLAAQQGHVGCVILLLPEGENSEEAALSLIAATKTVATTSSDGSKEPQAATEEATAAGEVGNVDEEKAKEQALKVAGIAVSDVDKSRASELKAEGNRAFAQKHWDDSATCYSSAIDINPTDATFYSNRSACYMMLGRPADALYDAVIARHLRPDWPKACYRTAVARLELGRYEDAALAAWEGLQQDQENEELKLLLQKCVKKGKKVHREALEAKRDENHEEEHSDLR